MNQAQKDTLIYIRNGLFQIGAIVAFAFIFAQAVAEWEEPAKEPAPEPVSECTTCGCVTETKPINIAGNLL